MDVILQGARIELARRHFYDYCQLIHGRFYLPERTYLKTLCDELQAFSEQDDYKFLVINMPPRHGKSFTAGSFTEWLFGRDTNNKVMTGSYNENLSTKFARSVRNTISAEKAGQNIVYSDIFPDTQIKYGEASASMWSLRGQSEPSYLATSPTGTATGMGCNWLLIDDVIKNATEAYNDRILTDHAEWLDNTMMQRTEGDWKVVVIATRWSTKDLAGHVVKEYGGKVQVVSMPAIQSDGSMLCKSILSRNDFAIKTKNMNKDIVSANYNQKPIDVKGRLYSSFKTYDDLPAGNSRKIGFIDTADRGTDFLCDVNGVSHDGKFYVTSVVFTDEAMEVTEPLVAKTLHEDDVDEVDVESNNGGRGFARNIKRELLERFGNVKVVVRDVPQTSNKEARILASSAWVQEYVYMPEGWEKLWPEFAAQLLGYQKKGRNAHDDAPDVLATIYENMTKPKITGW